jgi:hypothetical protein
MIRIISSTCTIMYCTAIFIVSICINLLVGIHHWLLLSISNNLIRSRFHLGSHGFLWLVSSFCCIWLKLFAISLISSNVTITQDGYCSFTALIWCIYSIVQIYGFIVAYQIELEQLGNFEECNGF